MSKTERINIRCTMEQKEALEERAQAHNMNISEYMIDCALREESSGEKELEMVFPNMEAERVRRQISIDELAEMLKVSRKTIHSWQAGKAEMPLSKLMSLAESWNLSADYILGLTDNPMGRKIPS